MLLTGLFVIIIIIVRLLMAGLPSHLLMFLKKLSAYGYIYKFASTAFDPLFYCCSVNGKICLAEILSSKLDPLFF